ADPQRSPIHDKEAGISLRGGREVLLCDDKAVTTYGVDHLVQVRVVVRADQEHAGTARPLQWLENDIAALRLSKRLDLRRVARDEGAWTHLFGKQLEVHLAGRL